MYHYAGNNPVRYTDPTGEFAIAIPLIPVAIEGIKDVALVTGAILSGIVLGKVATDIVKDGQQDKSGNQKTENAKQQLESNAQSVTPNPMPPDPNDEDENLEYESNPKHHQNARENASQEPKNAKEMFEKSVKDPTKDGTRWYKDKNGTLHRFMEHEKNKYHWNGSFSGKPSQLNGNVQKLYRCLPKGDI